MIYQAKSDTVAVRNGEMDYIRFGTGARILIMLPGLGDGLRTVKGTAKPMAAMYREFTRDFTVYAFSRINELPAGYTTRDMAWDLAQAMVFDSVSRMSRNADEGFKDYKMLYELGVNLIFLNEPLINTSVFDSTKNNLLNINIETGNTAVDDFFKGNVQLINNFMMALAEQQIKAAFEQSEIKECLPYTQML